MTIQVGDHYVPAAPLVLIGRPDPHGWYNRSVTVSLHYEADDYSPPFSATATYQIKTLEDLTVATQDAAVPRGTLHLTFFLDFATLVEIALRSQGRIIARSTLSFES